MLHACCMHTTCTFVACMAHICCMRVVCVLHVCCMYVACMLHMCCMHVEWREGGRRGTTVICLRVGAGAKLDECRRNRLQSEQRGVVQCTKAPPSTATWRQHGCNMDATWIDHAVVPQGVPLQRKRPITDDHFGVSKRQQSQCQGCGAQHRISGSARASSRARRPAQLFSKVQRCSSGMSCFLALAFPPSARYEVTCGVAMLRGRCLLLGQPLPHLNIVSSTQHC